MTESNAWDDLPESWVVWSDEDGGRVVLAFRPDVFDGSAYPPECLPTLYVSQRPPGQRRRRAGTPRSTWYVSFRLEPEVRVRGHEESFDSHAAAVEGAIDLATAFASGEIDHRGAYQVPREAYLDALDDLTE